MSEYTYTWEPVKENRIKVLSDGKFDIATITSVEQNIRHKIYWYQVWWWKFKMYFR